MWLKMPDVGGDSNVQIHVSKMFFTLFKNFVLWTILNIQYRIVCWVFMYLLASVNSDECWHLYSLHQIIFKEISVVISHQ